MVNYILTEEFNKLIKDIVNKLNLKYINTNRVKVVKSYGSKARSIARIYGVPKAVQVGLGLDPYYVIELISEKFDNLDYEGKLAIIIHELLHIPKTFSGCLKPHGKQLNNKVIVKLLRKYTKAIKKSRQNVDS